MKTFTIPSKLQKVLALAALLAPFACVAAEAEKKAPDPDPSAKTCFSCFIKKTDLKKRNCRLYWN